MTCRSWVSEQGTRDLGVCEYWARCVDGDLVAGPFAARSEAQAAVDAHDALAYDDAIDDGGTDD